MSSAAVTLVLPKAYGYVLAVTTAGFFVNFWHGARCSLFRKASGIPYPKAFADSGDLAAASPEQKKAQYVFNCAQRAHANFLENYTSTTLATLIAGVQYPEAAATLGGVWLVARIMYNYGYTNPNKEKGAGRRNGFILSFLTQLGVFGLAGYSAYKIAV